jgi:hypothetical protein
MKTKTTIITLAALSLGIAAIQAGSSGVIVTIAGADTQHQHSDGETLTFAPKNSSTSDIWCYKVKGYIYTLTTPDNKQDRGDIFGTIGTWQFLTIDKPEQRQVTNHEVTYTPARLVSGKDLQVIVDFEEAAALTGTFNLLIDIYPSEPTGADLGGDINAPVYALADAQPVITWSLNPTFGEE